MATKRLIIAPEVEKTDQPKEKRMRPMPSFASVIGEVMMARSVQCFVKSLEPMLRRVVNEEVERGIQRVRMRRSPSLRIEAPPPACLKLVFENQKLPQTIFTSNKILDVNEQPLKLRLVEKIGDQMTPKRLPQPLKVEIVVIDGDFVGETWSEKEFKDHIIKEREGKPALISKEVKYTIKQNESCISLGELEFTDNSSWIRSRKFKLGARVFAAHGFRIMEALTDAFIVKDQRGELYKKHYPPMLEDEVWRLEKIGKDGKFHQRLEEAGIKTVQDFLKLSVIDPTKLKKILGGMSDRMWDSVLKHAKTCNIGNKLYVCAASPYTILLDATCNIVSIHIDGQFYPALHFTTKVQRDIIEELVKNAYENWDSLQEVETAAVSDSLQQFQGGNEVGCTSIIDDQNMVPYEIVFGGVVQVDNTSVGGAEMEFENWQASPQHLFF